MSTPQNPGRKPRPEAVLQNLPAARQADLFSYMEGDGAEKGHSYSECVAWLAEDGISCTKQLLSKWRDWYYLRLGFQSARDDAKTLLDSEAEEGETIPEEKIQRVGNRLFSMQAIKTMDVKAWFLVQTVQQKDREIKQKDTVLAQNDRRIALLESKVKAAAIEVKKLREGTNLDAAERAAIVNKVDEILGIKS